jgi:hypothetical protein
MKNLTMIVVLFVVAALVGGVIWAWGASHPSLMLPDHTRRFCADIVVGLDLTHSMPQADQEMAKRIVSERLIPAVGPCDLLKVIEIGPAFNDANAIAGGRYEDQMPEIPEPAATKLHQLLRGSTEAPPGIISEQIRDIARQVQSLWPVVTERRSTWKQQISAARAQTDPGSRFSRFFEGSFAQFGVVDETGARKGYVNYVVVIGDLREEDGRGRPIVPMTPQQVPPNLKVLLVYPHESAHDWNSILNHWRDYLKGTDLTILTFGNADLQKTLLDPNPLAGLQSLDCRGLYDYLKSILPFELAVIVGAALTLLSGRLLLARRETAESVAEA